MGRYRLWLFLPLTIMIAGCHSSTPMNTADQVDLNRFMGTWYVIASIPTFIEKGAHNPIESYRLNANGTVATVFTFNQGAFDGPLKTYTAIGSVRDDSSNAVWDMQFVWPFKAEYRIAYVDAAYTQTIIGRSKRDYVWIMARSPRLPKGDYDRLLTLVGSLGYDPSQIRQSPHEDHYRP